MITAFPPSKPTHILFFAFFKTHGLFLHYLLLCGYMYTHTYIPKNNMLSLYRATWIYVFRADHSLLAKQLLSSPVEETISPTLSTP